MIKKEWREPYDPPRGECFSIRCCVDMLEDFSKEKVEGIEVGPDLTPREDDDFHPGSL